MEAIVASQLLYPGLGLASLLLVLRAILAVSGGPKPINYHPRDPFRRKAYQEFEANALGLIAKGLEMVRLSSRAPPEGVEPEGVEVENPMFLGPLFVPTRD